MGYRVLAASELSYEERPGADGAAPRHTADLTTAAGLSRSRARMWRYPPGARGRRHEEGAQEEVFVVLAGSLTLLLGEPPERVEVETGGVVVVEPETPLQLRNESDAETVVSAYGAPPIAGQSRILESPPASPVR